MATRTVASAMTLTATLAHSRQFDVGLRKVQLSRDLASGLPTLSQLLCGGVDAAEHGYDVLHRGAKTPAHPLSGTGAAWAAAALDPAVWRRATPGAASAASAWFLLRTIKAVYKAVSQKKRRDGTKRASWHIDGHE